MNTQIFNRLAAATLCVLLSVAAMPNYAGDAGPTRSPMRQTYAATGEVVAVDKAAGKVKLKHEAIPALEWPAMTMAFAVADRAQLDALATGSRVEFQFVQASGVLLIIQIRPIK